MNLDHQQKRYIKKHIKFQTIKQIAEQLDITENEIYDYLKTIWDHEAYQNFVLTKKHSNDDGHNIKELIFENKNIIIFLALIIFFAYFNSLKNAFVSDDLSSIVNNPNLQNLSSVFSPVMGFFQKLLYFIAWSISGLNPLYFRIINVVFHILATITAYLLLRIISIQRVAIIATTIFAVHPILTESVTWISGGPYPQYSFFFLLSFLLYVLYKKNKNTKYYYFSLVSFFFSLTISEKTIPLFIMFFIYEYFWDNLKKNWKKLLPYCVSSLILLLIFAAKIGYRTSVVEAATYSSGQKLNPFIQIPTAITSYLQLIFWPDKLTLYHTEMSFSTGNYLLRLISFILLMIAGIYSFRKNKLIFFSLCLFVISLSPTLTPLGISWIVAERYVYLGSLGIFVVLAVLFDKLTSKKENFKAPAYIIFSIIILALSIRTIVRNIDWKNEDNLWIATLKTSPSGPNIHNNMGDVYSRQGKTDKAIEEFKEAIRINPRYAEAYHNLANTYKQIGKYDEAIENYNKALEFNPNIWQTWQQLAAVYFQLEKYDLAQENMKKALEINPEDENLKQNLQIIEEKLTR